MQDITNAFSVLFFFFTLEMTTRSICIYIYILFFGTC